MLEINIEPALTWNQSRTEVLLYYSEIDKDLSEDNIQLNKTTIFMMVDTGGESN